MSKNYITPQGLDRLHKEYETLFRDERPSLVKTIAWAASNGDRSENADYIYGKRRLREIDRRLRYLSRRIDDAVIVAVEQARQAVERVAGSVLLLAPGFIQKVHPRNRMVAQHEAGKTGATIIIDQREQHQSGLAIARLVFVALVIGFVADAVVIIEIKLLGDGGIDLMQMIREARFPTDVWHQIFFVVATRKAQPPEMAIVRCRTDVAEAIGGCNFGQHLGIHIEIAGVPGEHIEALFVERAHAAGVFTA